jgi:hypothetical protein
MSGRQLAYRLRGLNATKRALLFAAIKRGEIQIVDHTDTQLCRMIKVSRPYACDVARASEVNREKLKRGEITIGQLREDERYWRFRRGEISLSVMVEGPPTDAEIKDYIHLAGLGRVWLVIDEMTRPSTAGAAE